MYAILTNMTSPLSLLHTPAAYHGRVLRPPFFEGWYFKLVNADLSARFALIPGIFLSAPGAEKASHAFIQVLDGVAGRSWYLQYSIEQFQASEHDLSITIDGNHFSAQGIEVNLQADGLDLRGKVNFSPLIPWPVTFFSPGVMGPFAFTPRMECYHGVLSFSHNVSGEFTANGNSLDFNGGVGYLEKDWGHAFPKAWVWFQSNHFDQPNVCITASVAVIPWLGTHFDGFIIGLWIAGKLYRFATYTGARLEQLHLQSDRVTLRLTQANLILELEAMRAAGGELRAPQLTGMDRRIAETLDANVRVQLSRRDGRDAHAHVIFKGLGRCAGLEVVGNLHERP